MCSLRPTAHIAIRGGGSSLLLRRRHSVCLLCEERSLLLGRSRRLSSATMGVLFVRMFLKTGIGLMMRRIHLRLEVRDLRMAKRTRRISITTMGSLEKASLLALRSEKAELVNGGSSLAMVLTRIFDSLKGLEWFIAFLWDASVESTDTRIFRD